MSVKVGEVCPCYNWVNVEMNHCSHCDCFKGIYVGGVIDCDYSEIPTYECPFKKGDMVYRLVHCVSPMPYIDHEKIRTSKWVRNHWEYQFGREQHYSRGYATKEEVARAMLEENVDLIKKTFGHMKSQMNRLGLSIEGDEIMKMIEVKKD